MYLLKIKGINFCSTTSAAIVHSPNFDSEIKKLLQYAEAELNADEVAALHLLKATSDMSQQSDVLADDDDFASVCLKKCKKYKILPVQTIFGLQISITNFQHLGMLLQLSRLRF